MAIETDEAARHYLASRLASLAGELDRVKKTWDALGVAGGSPEFVAELALVKARVGANLWFQKQFAPLRSSLSAISARVERGEHLAACWADYETLDEALRPTLNEALLYVEGAAGRATGVDRGLCRLTDALLDEISKATTATWSGTSIPANRDETSLRTWVIGIRYPDFRFWWLPVSVHELGHAAVSTLRDHQGTYPIPPLLSGTWPRKGQIAEFLAPPPATELFADLFATYTLGPAYPAALIWRALPNRAWERRDNQHPAWAIRVEACLRTLGDCGHGGWANQLRTQWDAVLASANSAARDGDVDEPLTEFLDAAMKRIRSCAPEGGFPTSDAALTLSEILDGTRLPGPGDAKPNLRTIVGAAWITRIRRGIGAKPDDDEDSELRAVALADGIVRHAGSSQ